VKESWRKFDLWCYNQDHNLRGIKTVLFTVAFVLWGFIGLNEFFMRERGMYMIEKRENQKQERELKLMQVRIDVLQEIVLYQEGLKK
jgi:hypothetical protein